ncbi:MAG: GntR family transcriptional regulator [Clostridiales bacterium]|nr:GntR family transcriptional regulator [Clostridiales bacterium]
MFTIDKMSRIPIYEQLINQFESRILSGDIGSDGQLPSVRYLSQSLNINPNTLQRAYTEIERRGLCYTVPGSGRYISKDALSKLKEAAMLQTAELHELLDKLKGRGVSVDTVLSVVDDVYVTDHYEERKAESE